MENIKEKYRIIILIILTLCLFGVVEASEQKQFGIVTGKVCYPSDVLPPMTVYARNTKNNETYTVDVKGGASDYTLKIPKTGEYVFFSWSHEIKGFNVLGGIYSQAVVCGLRRSCDNHTLLPVKVKLGERLDNIDICDYYYPSHRVNEFVPKP